MKLDKSNKELYYLENGMVVFTPIFHINRGHCCGNGCRHCPYEPTFKKENTKLQIEWERIYQQDTAN